MRIKREKQEVSTKNCFVVCMDSSYVRDAQMVNTNKLSKEEFEQGFFFCNSDYDHLWYDIEPNPFIDIVYAENQAEACNIAGEHKRYDPRCLYAIPIPVSANE